MKNSSIELDYLFIQVIICCLTPMYIASNMCQRELILADMLKKPIIPVMFEITPWPPLGAASLILSQLTYIDLKGKISFTRTWAHDFDHNY